jgi:glycosyl transferase family 25
MQKEPVYDKIDIVYYINLNYRTDRKESFLNEMKKIKFPEEKISRFQAIKNDRGEIGCSRSHIEVLKQFINSNHNNCIIFEDDFMFQASPEKVKSSFTQLFNNNIDYDVVMLAGNTINNTPTNLDFLLKVNNCQTASGYIVSKKFAQTLLDNYIEGEKLLSSHDRSYYPVYAIDQYWKRLQPNSKWYIFNPSLGKQIGSYSDIEKGYVNYNL